MKKISATEKEYRRLTTPRAAAIAGILFGLLFAASLMLLRSAIPDGITTDITWTQPAPRKSTLPWV